MRKEFEKRSVSYARAAGVKAGDHVILHTTNHVWVRVTSRFKNGNFKGVVVASEPDPPQPGEKIRFGKCHIFRA